MVEHFLEVLGKPFIIPAAILIVGTSVIKMLSGLHDSKRQHRKEFLELWEDAKSMNDMRLEVITRHLVGTYLPAGVIRAANGMSFPTQALFDLAEIWPLITLDYQTGKLSWNKTEYEVKASRRWLRAVLMVGYLVFACIAVLFFYLAVGTDPTKPTAWISAANTLMFGVIAWACLARFDTLGAVGRQGLSLISRINATLPVKAP